MIASRPDVSIYWAAVVACALVLVVRVGAARLTHRRHRQALEREPRCGSCGYILARGTSPVCPECGRDVREHGLVTARCRRAVGPLPLYVLLTLIALPIAIKVGPAAAEVQPLLGWRYHYSQMVSLQWEDGSYGGPRYAVQSEGCRRLGAGRPEYVVVYCNSGSDERASLAVDIGRGRFSLVDGAGAGPATRPIDGATVVKFLRLRSPNEAPERLADAAERIVAAVRAQVAGDVPPAQQSGDVWNGAAVSYWVSDEVTLVACLVTWGMVSSLAVASAVRWRRRALRGRRGLWRSEAARLGLVVESGEVDS